MKGNLLQTPGSELFATLELLAKEGMDGTEFAELRRNTELRRKICQFSWFQGCTPHSVDERMAMEILGYRNVVLDERVLGLNRAWRKWFSEGRIYPHQASSNYSPDDFKFCKRENDENGAQWTLICHSGRSILEASVGQLAINAIDRQWWIQRAHFLGCNNKISLETVPAGSYLIDIAPQEVNESCLREKQRRLGGRQFQLAPPNLAIESTVLLSAICNNTDKTESFVVPHPNGQRVTQVSFRWNIKPESGNLFGPELRVDWGDVGSIGAAIRPNVGIIRYLPPTQHH